MSWQSQVGYSAAHKKQELSMREKNIDTLGNGGIYKDSHEKKFYSNFLKMELKKLYLVCTQREG